jgi:hypothetical protein
VRRHTLLILALALATAPPAAAGTFQKVPLAPDLGLDALTKGVARTQLGRDLLANPYATVTLSHVDLYDVFPYVESRDFQIVSDPQWNRLVFGERGRGLSAFDGRTSTSGALKAPRGMAVDEFDRVYVADAGNNRIVVLQARTTYGAMTLEPLFVINGLSGPYDVAYSDGGTPFKAGDDRLYVADTGRNRVVSYALEAAGARYVAAIGDLGSGPGRFAGPMAITVGRDAAGSTRDLYVADAHNRRIARLSDDGRSFRWVQETPLEADVVTSLDTDRWGNVYAAAPRAGSVQKFAADLTPVGAVHQGLNAPRSFQIAFASVEDHRDGTRSRVGRPSGVTVEQWDNASGIARWDLGLEVSGLGVAQDGASVHFGLSDQARVTIEVVDPANGRRISRRTTDPLGAGAHTVALLPEETAGQGDRLLRLTAASTYDGGPSASAQTSFRPGGGTGAMPSRPMMLGATPNPAVSFARISFLLPANPGRVALRVLDAQGRKVRTFGGSFTAGLNEVVWDGTDDRGHPLGAGVYFSDLDVAGTHHAARLVWVK